MFVVTIVEIHSGKVKLGVIAPRDTPVHRREIYEKIHRAEEMIKSLCVGIGLFLVILGLSLHGS